MQKHPKKRESVLQHHHQYKLKVTICRNSDLFICRSGTQTKIPQLGGQTALKMSAGINVQAVRAERVNIELEGHQKCHLFWQD